MTIAEAYRKFELLRDDWARGKVVNPVGHSWDCINIERELHRLEDCSNDDRMVFILRRDMRYHVRVVWGCELIHPNNIDPEVQKWLLSSDHGDE